VEKKGKKKQKKVGKKKQKKVDFFRYGSKGRKRSRLQLFSMNASCNDLFTNAGPLTDKKAIKHNKELELERAVVKRDISFQNQSLLEVVKRIQPTSGERDGYDGAAGE
jgi:hypothetical protein